MTEFRRVLTQEGRLLAVIDGPAWYLLDDDTHLALSTAIDRVTRKGCRLTIGASSSSHDPS
jgi:hypothetical protein